MRVFRQHWAVALGMLAVIAGGAGVAMAHASGSRCYLETIESWSWLNMFNTVYMAGSESAVCRDAGCQGAGGTCPSTPTTWSPDPYNPTLTKQSCGCNGAGTADPTLFGGSYCSTVAVTDSDREPHDPDRTYIECLNVGCTVCAILTTFDPHGAGGDGDPPAPPTEYSRTQSCACQK